MILTKNHRRRFINADVPPPHNDNTGFGHEVFQITLKNSEKYVLDIAGAQYGQFTPFMPCDVYAQSHVKDVVRSLDFGSTRERMTSSIYCNGSTDIHLMQAVNNSMFAPGAYKTPPCAEQNHNTTYTNTHKHTSSNFKFSLHFSKLSPTAQQPARTIHHHNPTLHQIHFSSIKMSRRSTNGMSRDSVSGMSRYGGSQSRGAESRDGYSHPSSSRSHTTSSNHASREYDDDLPPLPLSPGRHPGGYTERRIQQIRDFVAKNDREGYGFRTAENYRQLLATADRQADEYYSRNSGSNGGSYGGGSADYSSSHGASVSHSGSSRSGTSRGPSIHPSTHGESRGSSSTRRSTRGESRAPSALPRIQEESRVSESRASGGASRALARITGGQSNGGHSSSHAGRELARRH